MSLSMDVDGRAGQTKASATQRRTRRPGGSHGIRCVDAWGTCASRLLRHCLSKTLCLYKDDSASNSPDHQESGRATANIWFEHLKAGIHLPAFAEQGGFTNCLCEVRSIVMQGRHINGSRHHSVSTTHSTAKWRMPLLQPCFARTDDASICLLALRPACQVGDCDRHDSLWFPVCGSVVLRHE